MRYGPESTSQQKHRKKFIVKPGQSISAGDVASTNMASARKKSVPKIKNQRKNILLVRLHQMMKFWPVTNYQYVQ